MKHVIDDHSRRFLDADHSARNVAELAYCLWDQIEGYDNHRDDSMLRNAIMLECERFLQQRARYGYTESATDLIGVVGSLITVALEWARQHSDNYLHADRALRLCAQEFHRRYITKYIDKKGT